MSIGNRLRERRCELGLELEALAATTRIRRTYLEALENDRFDLLPGEAYASGFLRSYAKALGLDGVALDRERRPPSEAAVVVEPSQREVRRRPEAAASGGRRTVGVTRRRPLLPAVVILLAAALLAPLIFYLTVRDARDTTEIAEPVTPPVAVPAPAAVEVADITAHQQGPVPADAGSALPTVPVIPVGGAVLRAEASAEVRLEVSVDGRPTRSYALGTDSALRWPVQQSVRLRVDDPAQIRLWLDDRPLELGDRHELFLPPAEAATPEGQG